MQTGPQGRIASNQSQNTSKFTFCFADLLFFNSQESSLDLVLSTAVFKLVRFICKLPTAFTRFVVYDTARGGQKKAL